MSRACLLLAYDIISHRYMNIETPLAKIRGVGPQFILKLKRLGIETVRDLLYHFPSRYEDWSEIAKISDLKLGETKTIQAEVKEIEVKRAWNKRMNFVEAVIEDDSGNIKVVWFNQTYIARTLKPGTIANFAGKLAVRRNEAYLSNPSYELIGAKEKMSQIGTKHTGRLVPIYPETKGLTSRGIRYLVSPLIEQYDNIEDFLPEEIREEYNLLEINDALRKVHFPENLDEAERAKYRFAFEEIFLLQLRNKKQKEALKKESAPNIEITKKKIDVLIKSLPYELTGAQQRAVSEIVSDINKDYPMNRLLQGDVGSGKTVVAGIPALALADTHQVAIMAPTEILARQHYKTFTKVFSGFSGGIALLVGKEAKIFYGEQLESVIKKEKLFKDIETGKVKIIIGTHALIQKKVKFNNLGLVIIDEQHRFGVNQRQQLTKGKNIVPHFLSMSATPIPRTMMIALFADLDVSIINELPKGRKEIITKVVANENRDKAYAFIRGQVRQGRQVYVICPRIQKPDEDKEGIDYKEKLTFEMKAVEEEYKKLSKKVFPDLRVSMLHGKMKADEKAKIMSDFADHKSDILISTSVIEVGVDVPNTTIMMVESAERFGLAQLYQFRGRVGRGDKQSFCFLFTESNTKISQDRLKALVSAKNGYELAELDLKLRGPGQFMGDVQTGLPDIAMQSLKNPNMVKEARDAAEEVISKDLELKSYPMLRDKLEKLKERIHME